MATAIHMPQVGQDIRTARIVEWRKKAGDPVQKGEVVAIVESDKAVFEVQSDQAGVLLKIKVPAGGEGAVFEPIAWVGEPGEPVSDGPASDGIASVPSPGPAISPAMVETPGPVAEHRLATPAIRRVARERGVDLSQVKGTGPGGRILKEDVLAAAAAREGVPPVSRATDRAARNRQDSRTPGS
ncbi:MAG TPA: E3 binding domain-containing protein [Candidatus Paceibacterota bacterium]|nr:E3 binding domain-containing protein [Verrucomicrobiota bacterium]HOX04212.1 E3 binding domain-containing protein [Verrucomicrobiota bacterium]HRZ47158.1 E3 binding domain-containing protein [Candidatus Paceibacterota bacterium]HRZ92856.1 E3 binding domain-containing protein [Candidatus Paceibacterota bacterium]